MRFLKKDADKRLLPRAASVGVQTGRAGEFDFFRHAGEFSVYAQLRESVPIIDAAIYKLCRLLGSFEVKCSDSAIQEKLSDFLRTVRVNAMNAGIDTFICTYFEQLLTFGTAVGEVAVSENGIEGLLNVPLADVELCAGPLEAKIYSVVGSERKLCEYPELILVSALNPKPGEIYGTSILKGLPFVSDILLTIYKSMGVNFERMGSVRFAVTAKPDDSGSDAREQAEAMAEQWKQAMRSPGISDFVSVGEVDIKPIGVESQMIDSEAPVRQMLEQIVAKLGVPPFLLGLSWSSTERMSSQQADVLTSEIEAYRRVLNPVIEKIIRLWMEFAGVESGFYLEWNDITMQDELDHAKAMKLMAETKEIESRLKGGEDDGC